MSDESRSNATEIEEMVYSELEEQSGLAARNVLSFSLYRKLRGKLTEFDNRDKFVPHGEYFYGTMWTTKNVFVDGSLIDIDLSANFLLTGSKSLITGSAVVGKAEFFGSFIGSIYCAEELVLRPGSVVEGHIYCSALVVHRGAKLRGDVFQTDEGQVSSLTFSACRQMD